MVRFAIFMAGLALAPSAQTVSPNDFRLRHISEQQPIEFKHKGDLPSGVLAALGFDMADAGEPFQATDVIFDKSLPFRRFILARQVGDTFTIEYEQGGIAHRFEKVTVQRQGDTFTASPP